MSDASKIEWTDATWNPVRGCSRVSEGCRNCYAERIASRFSGPGQPFEWFAKDGKWTGEVFLEPEKLLVPLRWRKPRKIFVNSMSDLFHEELSDRAIAAVFGVMAACPHHIFQVLTKRPEAAARFMGKRLDPFGDHAASCDWWARQYGVPLSTEMSRELSSWPPPNVLLGVSVEDQPTADERIPILLRIPAAVRFVSYEPALGPIDVTPYLPRVGRCETCWSRAASTELAYDSKTEAYYAAMKRAEDEKAPCTQHVGWVIAGGESGPRARPAHPDWFRSVRDQCVAAGVPFFFKQWGECIHRSQLKYNDRLAFEIDQAENLAGNPEEWWRVGKKRAGRLLDGREWNEVPR